MPLTPDLDSQTVSLIRGLSMDGPLAANSGHQGTAMALAPLAHVLYSRVMTHDPAERRVSIRHFLPSHKEGQELIAQMTAYFKGEKVEFDVPLPTRAGSEAQRGVWTGLKGIPYGQVETYEAMTKRLGLPQRGARVLGSVCGQNPLPVLYPSHRLLPENGGLVGFVGGIKWRRALLELEGILVDYDRVKLPNAPQD